MFDRQLGTLATWFRPAGSAWRITPWLFRDDSASVQSSLLRLLALAHRENLALAPLLAHFANEHRGSARRRLRQLANRLYGGASLMAAIEETPHVLNDEDALTLRFATQSGILAAAYQELLDRDMQATQATSAGLRQSKIYFVSLFLVVVVATFFLVTFIAPTLQHVSEEIGGSTLGRGDPALMQFLALVGGLFYYAPTILALAMIAATLVWIVKPGRIFRRTIASSVLRPLAQLRTAHVLRLLSIASEAGRPLPGSLSTLARYHFDKTFRSKLLFARNEVEQGAEAWRSLAVANLLSAKESEALAASDSSQSRIWLMRRLAQWKEDQSTLRWSVLVGLIHPALVLLFGAYILWLATAFFGVLCNLIQSLA